MTDTIRKRSPEDVTKRLEECLLGATLQHVRIQTIQLELNFSKYMSPELSCQTNLVVRSRAWVNDQKSWDLDLKKIDKLEIIVRNKFAFLASRIYPLIDKEVSKISAGANAILKVAIDESTLFIPAVSDEMEMWKDSWELKCEVISEYLARGESSGTFLIG